MTPFVKWAGGKGQVLERILALIPQQFNNYYEPFLGGGAVLLGAHPQQGFANDINEQLINAFIRIKDNLNDLLAEIAMLDMVPCDKDFYIARRAEYNEYLAANYCTARSAALFIWLNKHCFNGLYRVNSRGLFNVPYNNRINGASININNINEIHEYLQNADIHFSSVDFVEFCADVGAGDLVYFDSPYVPLTETANFTDYTIGGFTYEDHQRLANLYRELDVRGAQLILSNNDVPLVYELYQGFNIQAFDVRRLVNRNANGRSSREVLITNF
ncbi:Dam family site-specific DNA-(adenine-N6)-methyltransferase [Phascolarctobacterium sp.]|uniref:DNA adenine methylase n=1 Tax=Phascolarctobacterium sp. TaxID=2049039 RepID=UPI002A7FA595|nr:Dam family site-specific DNA-(adenine-N6)-methyltransferase [Phascolarctobacterium sp.]MDY5045943.1 Dam family site-specific DNA-(adenine-N6)-methyltransferase [Phascolarctobacterium sp.]